jgi:zeaxanthin glucosyltransferase
MPAETQPWHFGVLSFTGTGHLIPLFSLAQELQHRGHKVTFFEKPKVEERVRQAGLNFIPIGAKATLKRNNSPSKSSGARSDLSTLRFNLERIIQDVHRFLAETPTAVTDAGVNALIINEIAITGPTVAQMLGLPYFIISTSVPHSFGWNGFPWRPGYRYSSSSLSWLQRSLLELSCLRLRGPIRRALDRYRRQLGLGPTRTIWKDFPFLAHITQLPQSLDFPRKSLPENFYYTGPFVGRTARPPVEFPWDCIDGRPLIYASFGTTRNVQPTILRLVAEACRDIDAQLVLSLGNRFDPTHFADLPGRPLLVKYAPQLELLEIARLVIAHGGANTTFEALAAGKPMLLIPLAYDQPAMAARLARLKIAEVLPVMRLSSKRIRTAITRLLGDDRYHRAAMEMRSTIGSLRGVERSADVIEESLVRYFAGHLQEAPTPNRTPDLSGAKAASFLQSQ